MDDILAIQPCHNCAQVTSSGCSLPDRVKKKKVRRKLLRRGHCDLWEGKKMPCARTNSYPKTALLHMDKNK